MAVPVPAAFYPQPYNCFDRPSLSRSSTRSFTTSTTIAIDRVHQLSNHLSRSNSLVLSQEADNKEDANMSAPINDPSQSSNAPDPTAEPRPTLQRSTTRLDSDVPDVDGQLAPLPKDWNEGNKHEKFQHFICPFRGDHNKFSVFLAGSIEMGKAIQWQPRMVQHLQHLPITVNNPRRGEWVVAEGKAMDEAMKIQIEWELEKLDQSTVICFFFDHNTTSPVTLMELGLWANSGKVVVCCDKKYWRATNVHRVCEKYKVPYTDTMEELIPLIKHKLKEFDMEFDESEDVRIPEKINNNALKAAQWECTMKPPAST